MKKISKKYKFKSSHVNDEMYFQRTNTGYIALDQNPINKITAHLILILPSKNSSLNILMKAFIEKNKILFYVSEEIQEVNFFFQS